jgi:hypothetical protein
MTLAAFTGTPVLDDGKVATRSLAVGHSFIGEQQAAESIVEKSQTDYVMRVGIMWGSCAMFRSWPRTAEVASHDRFQHDACCI